MYLGKLENSILFQGTLNIKSILQIPVNKQLIELDPLRRQLFWSCWNWRREMQLDGHGFHTKIVDFITSIPQHGQLLSWSRENFGACKTELEKEKK